MSNEKQSWLKKTSSYCGEYFTFFKKGLKLKNYWIYLAFAIFIVVAGSLSGTGNMTNSMRHMFEQIGYTIIASVSLSLVVGFLGELSLGHAGFMSIGAFVGILFQETVLSSMASNSSTSLLALVISMLVGGLAAAVFGFIISLPALRLKGDYLAIVTLAFGEIVKVIFQNIKISDADGNEIWNTVGLKNPYRYDDKTLFIVIFVVALLFIILIRNLLRSPHGRNIMAIRDNEIAAKAMGVNVIFYKVFVFVLSSFMAGIAGVFFGSCLSTVTAVSFNYNYSINNILVVVVLGGMGNLTGTIISAILVSIVNIRLGAILTGDMAAIKNIIFAAVLVLVVMYNNAPALKGFRERYNFRNLLAWVKKKLKFKSKSKETADDNPSDDPTYSADWSKVPTKIPMDAVLTTDMEVKPDESSLPSDKEGE